MRVTTDDGSVKMSWNINTFEVATVVSDRRWLDGEHVSKCATVAKTLKSDSWMSGA